VMFKGPIEALYQRALRDRIDAGFKERLRSLGLDLDRPLLAAYPYETFRAVFTATLVQLYGPSPSIEQQREFGVRWTESFFETFLGTAILGVLKLIGPRRAMLRSAQNYKNVNNYSDAKVVELGPGHFELWLSDGDDWPEVTAGSLQRSVELAGAKNVTTKVVRREGKHNVYEARWAS
jgi:uncharacterized protein (TIGR02265 family)